MDWLEHGWPAVVVCPEDYPKVRRDVSAGEAMLVRYFSPTETLEEEEVEVGWCDPTVEPLDREAIDARLAAMLRLAERPKDLVEAIRAASTFLQQGDEGESELTPEPKRARVECDGDGALRRLGSERQLRLALAVAMAEQLAPGETEEALCSRLRERWRARTALDQLTRRFNSLQAELAQRLSQSSGEPSHPPLPRGDSGLGPSPELERGCDLCTLLRMATATLERPGADADCGAEALRTLRALLAGEERWALAFLRGDVAPRLGAALAAASAATPEFGLALASPFGALAREALARAVVAADVLGAAAAAAVPLLDQLASGHPRLRELEFDALLGALHQYAAQALPIAPTTATAAAAAAEVHGRVPALLSALERAVTARVADPLWAERAGPRLAACAEATPVAYTLLRAALWQLRDACSGRAKA